MIVKGLVLNAPLEMTPVEERVFELSKCLEVGIITDDGVYRIRLEKGFQSNLRSGSNILDCIIPHCGNQMVAVAYLVHDMFYSCDENGEHLASKEIADKLLEAMLVYAGVSKVKAKLVKKSVQWFGNTAWNEYDTLCKRNQGLYSFRWDAK